MKQLFIIMFICIIATITSCYYDSEEKLYPVLSTSCDLENVTFSGTVKPMLQYACLSCHSNANSTNKGSGIKLENYEDFKTQASTRLMGAVKHESGYSHMPLEGGKLTDCEINQIQKWIDNGMLNN